MSIIFPIAVLIFIIVWVLTHQKQYKAIAKTVVETKCQCRACGNVWYYGSKEAWEARTAGDLPLLVEPTVV